LGKAMVSRAIKMLIAIATVIIVVVSLVLAQTYQPSIDYWLEKPDTFTEGLNHITAYCKNDGGLDGDFNLVMKFHNSTFSDETELPYERVDDFTVKIHFVLHGGDSNQKTVYFQVWDITTVFSITLTLEKASAFVLFQEANAVFPTKLSYRWNENTKVFDYVESA
jgi:hypothetical protein